MLVQRVLTALVLVPLVVSGLLWLPTDKLAWALGAVFMLGAAELAKLANVADRGRQALFSVVVALVFVFAWFWRDHPAVPALIAFVSVWWIAATTMLMTRRSALEPVEHTRPLILAWGGLVLLIAWLSVLGLHAAGDRGPELVLFLFILVWVADSAAFFAGRRFGRRKLSPFVSPGKTWAGAVGAMLGAVVCALALMFVDSADGLPLSGLIVLCLLVTAVSIGGDLWESRLKRESGVKDSGGLLPGHGGVLDRIDSLIAAAPVFVLGLNILELAQ